MALSKGLARAAVTAAALIALAGCGSDRAGSLGLRDILPQAGAKSDAAPRAATQADINAALSASGPVEYVARPDQSGWSFLLRLEQNGGYETFGNTRRQTFTMKRGMVTATRGLGGDLMSSDVDQVLALISARRAGQAQRVMRFLNGENQTVAITLNCTVTPGAAQQVSAGQLKTRATQVSETCTAGSRSFTNTYLVDGKGHSVSSQQWLGLGIGALQFQTLRR